MFHIEQGSAAFCSSGPIFLGNIASELHYIKKIFEGRINLNKIVLISQTLLF